MADTIRDVTIRIGLELRQAELRIPPISTAATSALADDLNEVQTATESVEQATEDYNRVSSRALQQQRQQVRDLFRQWGEADESVRDLTDAFIQMDQAASAIEDTRQRVEDLTDAEENLSEQLRRQAAEGDRAQQVLQDFGPRVAESFSQAGEGALRAARGIALLTGGTDIERIVQQVARLQGVLDVFAGIGSTTRGLVTTFRAVATASEAAAVANTTLTAAQTGTAVSAGAAAVGVRGLIASLLPFAGVAAGVTTVLGVGAIAFSQWGREAEEAEERISELRAEAEALPTAEQLDFRSALRDAAGDALALQEQLSLVTQELSEAREATQALGTPGQLDVIIGAAPVRSLEEQRAAQQNVLTLERERADILRQLNDLRRQSTEAQQQELETARQLADAEASRERSQQLRLAQLTGRDRFRAEGLLRQVESGRTLQELTDAEIRQGARLFGGRRFEEEQLRRTEGFRLRAEAAGFFDVERTQRQELARVEEALQAGRDGVDVAQQLVDTFAALTRERTEIDRALIEQSQETIQRLNVLAAEMQRNRDFAFSAIPNE